MDYTSIKLLKMRKKNKSETWAGTGCLTQNKKWRPGKAWLRAQHPQLNRPTQDPQGTSYRRPRHRSFHINPFFCFQMDNLRNWEVYSVPRGWVCDRLDMAERLNHKDPEQNHKDPEQNHKDPEQNRASVSILCFHLSGPVRTPREQTLPWISRNVIGNEFCLYVSKLSCCFLKGSIYLYRYIM